VASDADVPIAAGEEWHNLHEAAWRLERAPLAFVQPEIAHTGVSQFVAIADLAAARGIATIPHATIGVGIFMAASLHAAATLDACPYHEYQHSIFDGALRFVDTAMRCDNGFYALPAGPGLGVTPNAALWPFIVPA
jgi:galactonate dehydratase